MMRGNTSRGLIGLLLLACCVPAAPAGKSVMLDPQLAYYKDRTPESIVEELKANDCQEVHLRCASESGIDGALVKGLKDAGIKVWMQTFCNGVYSRADLPKGWEAWRMKLRKAPSTNGFTHLCPNNPAYREWKKKQVTTALNAYAFAGVDLAEPFIPAYPGPESEEYGCFCDSCRARWGGISNPTPADGAPSTGGDVPGFPDFEDKKSPRYWRTDTTLYDKWVGFRVSAVIGWLDDLVNGKDGIREKCPGKKVATWSVGLDIPDQVAKLREFEAIDGAAIVRRVKPDAHVIQTDWPDRMRDDLHSDYPVKYQPVVDSIRDIAPSIPLLLQTDIGSKQNLRRGRQWIAEVEEAAKKTRFTGVLHYEYSLGDYAYTEPPKIVEAALEPGVIKLVFSKRLDPMGATNISSYSLNAGRVDFAKLDGNIVRLSVSGVDSGAVLSISPLSDDALRRLFRDRPACMMPTGIEVVIE